MPPGPIIGNPGGAAPKMPPGGGPIILIPGPGGCMGPITTKHSNDNQSQQRFILQHSKFNILKKINEGEL